MQLCFPPLCAYNSLPDTTKRSSNIKISLSYTLCKNEILKGILVEMIGHRVCVCEVNAIFTGQRTSKSSVVKESTTHDVVTEKMTSFLEEGDEY